MSEARAVQIASSYAIVLLSYARVTQKRRCVQKATHLNSSCVVARQKLLRRIGIGIRRLTQCNTCNFLTIQMSVSIQMKRWKLKPKQKHKQYLQII